MRSLFLRIFLSFWLATILIGTIVFILTLSSDPRQAEIARLRNKLTDLGNRAAAVYEQAGPEALSDLRLSVEQKDEIHLYLFKEGSSVLPQPSIPRGLPSLVAQAQNTGEPQFRPGRPGRRGNLLTFPLESGYILAAELPPPSKLQWLLDPRRLGMRLAVTLIVAGFVCYLLARSLTSPIEKLGQATRRFAAGEFSTRVSPEIHGASEITDLGRDFDRMAEHIENLLGSQQRLLRDISHELRSPLARLGVALELVRQNNPDGSTKALDRIELEAGRMNEMIGQLLDLARLETEAQSTNRTDFDLSQLLLQAATDADFEARGKESSVLFEGPQRLILHGHQGQLRRAVENVLRNAVHYTVEGTTVEIRLDKTEKGQGVRIRVRDHGPGVPEAELEKIFHPFYRVGLSRDRKSGGTGIGLAIAERTLRLHGGSIRAENAADGGLVVVMEV